MIGNTDNHIKNSSLVYSKDLSSVHLAPFYDVVCTKLYESSTDEMSVSINGHRNINEKEAEICGLGKKAAMNIYDELYSNLIPALQDSAKELAAAGFPEALDMAEKIADSLPTAARAPTDSVSFQPHP